MWCLKNKYQSFFSKSYIREKWGPFEVIINIFNQIKTLSFDFIFVFQWWHLLKNFT